MPISCADVCTAPPADQFVFERNPYYHRIDKQGQQLPYVDRIVMDVSASGLFAAKANAGEVDLLFNSRRVGLTPDGEPVRLLGGARLVGRVSGWDR